MRNGEGIESRFIFFRARKYGGLRLESVTPTALFPTNYTLTQGSLRYRLATLGYQKGNTYGVETFMLFYYSWCDS